MSGGGHNHQLPRWLLIAAVLGSGLLTGWAMWQSQAEGPQSSWGLADSAVSEIWAQPGQPAAPASPYTSDLVPAQPVAWAPMTAAAMAAQTSLVARVRGAPQILWGTNRPHGDRGTCTQCHTVLQRNGRPVPMVLSSSSMPHAFRGVCSNCHTVSGNGPVGPRPVAMPVVAAPGAMPTQPFPPQAFAGAPGPAAPQRAVGAQPQEVEWRGLETRAGAQGVMVSNVDGTARRAGVMPGDVIVSLNGSPVNTMAQLEALTMNGNLPQGTIIVRRNGQRMAFELRNAPGVGITAPTLGAAPARPGMMGALQPMAGM